MIKPSQRVELILSLVNGPDVLDVGCAGHVPAPGHPGWLHGRLRESFNVIGIDISEANLARLKGTGYSKLHVQSAETFSLAQKFDTIVAGEVIEHTANPGQFFERARQHLKPGGQLIISTPNVFSIMYYAYALGRYPKTCQNGEHCMWYCLATLSELAGRYGFTVSQVFHVKDYEPGVESRLYHAFWRISALISPFLPHRILSNTMVFVLL